MNNCYAWVSFFSDRSEIMIISKFYLHCKCVENSTLEIFCFRSLGGAVATQLASQPWCAKQAMCLVLENTFTSLPDIGRHIFDIRPIHYIPSCAYKNKVCLMVYHIWQNRGRDRRTNGLYNTVQKPSLYT